MLFMGVDLGTTNVKISLYNNQGISIASSQFHTPVMFPSPGWAEYEPDTLWGILSEEVALLLGELDRGQQVVSLSISSQAETGLLVDRNNLPLTKMITWYDNRTVALAKAWEQRISAEELFHITGLKLHYIHSLLKLEWIRDHWPDEYEKADKWHCMSDYITRKICGEAAMDYSLASRTMAFDIERKEWSQKMLQLAGIRPELMPPLKQAGTLLGKVLPEVAVQWRINPEAKVAVGGFDHMCGCIGLNANRNETIVASIGTTESVCLYRENAGLTISPKGYTVGRHVFPEAFYWLGGMPAGGETIDWAIRMLLRREPDAESYSEFISLAESSAPGSNGILFLPHLKGCITPVIDPDSRGSFWGLHIKTKREDLCRAVIEGLTYEFRFVLEQTAMEVSSIVAIGGGAKNSCWMQCKADVLNTEIRTIEMDDTVTFGAALLGGQAAGTLGREHSFRIKEKKTFRPDPIASRMYEEIYQKKYKLLYEVQKTTGL
jgi:xylulokinase